MFRLYIVILDVLSSHYWKTVYRKPYNIFVLCFFNFLFINNQNMSVTVLRFKENFLQETRIFLNASWNCHHPFLTHTNTEFIILNLKKIIIKYANNTLLQQKSVFLIDSFYLHACLALCQYRYNMHMRSCILNALYSESYYLRTGVYSLILNFLKHNIRNPRGAVLILWTPRLAVTCLEAFRGWRYHKLRTLCITQPSPARFCFF